MTGLPAIPEPLVILHISQTWQEGMGADETYECARKAWRLNPRARDCVKYALAVANGVVRGAYRIEPRSWEIDRVKVSEKNGSTHTFWQFTGDPAPELQEFIGTTVRAKRRGESTQHWLFLNGYPG